MADYREALGDAAVNANALVRHLESLGDAEHASRADVDRARALADEIERVLCDAVRTVPQSAANAAAYQALEAVDSLGAAADGNDVALMGAAAYEIRDHLRRACEAAEHSAEVR